MTILKDYIKKIKDLDVVRDDSYKKADDELKNLKRKCVEQIDDQITQMAYQILNDTTDRLG
jgi:ribosome recycling factor